MQAADKEEIRDVLMRYGRGVDRLDEDLIRSCYHDDSFDDHGHWKGNGQDFAAFIVESLRERSHHTTHATMKLEWSGLTFSRAGTLTNLNAGTGNGK